MPLTVNRERAPWLGASFDYVVPAGRDAFGVPLPGGEAAAGLPCRVSYGPVEVSRGGATTRQDGISVETPWQDFVAVGGLAVVGGVAYAVVGLDARTDYKGARRYAVLRCVARPGGA